MRRVVLSSTMLAACVDMNDYDFDPDLLESSSGAGSSSSSSSGDDDGETTGGADETSSTGGGTAPFAVELPADKTPHCLTPGESLLDFVVPGSGDGTPITCAVASGVGEGSLPAGVSLDEDTCTLVGDPPPDRFGTWVAMVEATQSGVQAWVPYCVTQDALEGVAMIEVLRTASGTDDVALLPYHGTFDGSGTFSAGSPGDPEIRVIEPLSCSESGCEYGYAFFVSGSPFDLETSPISDDMVLELDAVPSGLSHGIALTGTTDDDFAPFAERPWAVVLELDYCLGMDLSECPADAIDENADARFVYSVVMTPQ